MHLSEGLLGKVLGDQQFLDCCEPLTWGYRPNFSLLRPSLELTEVFLRLNPKSQAWRYWNEVRKGYRSTSKLSPTVILILAFLDDVGEAYQRQIALGTELDQGNLSGRHLPNLCEMGWIKSRPSEHVQYRGEPAKLYSVTDKAKVLLRLISEYDGGGVLQVVCNTGPHFVQKGGRYVAPTIPSCQG
jgi:DNA-binding MarR family transcriptional regulator